MDIVNQVIDGAIKDITAMIDDNNAHNAELYENRSQLEKFLKKRLDEEESSYNVVRLDNSDSNNCPSTEHLEINAARKSVLEEYPKVIPVDISKDDFEAEPVKPKKTPTAKQIAGLMIDHIVTVGGSEDWVKISYTDFCDALNISGLQVAESLKILEAESTVRIWRLSSGPNMGNNFTFNQDIPPPKEPKPKNPEPPKIPVAVTRAQKFHKFLEENGAKDKWLPISETRMKHEFNWIGNQIANMKDEAIKIGVRFVRLSEGSNKGWHYTLNHDIPEPKASYKSKIMEKVQERVDAGEPVVEQAKKAEAGIESDMLDVFKQLEKNNGPSYEVNVAYLSRVLGLTDIMVARFARLLNDKGIVSVAPSPNNRSQLVVNMKVKKTA